MVIHKSRQISQVEVEGVHRGHSASSPDLKRETLQEIVKEFVYETTVVTACGQSIMCKNDDQWEFSTWSHGCDAAGERVAVLQKNSI